MSYQGYPRKTHKGPEVLAKAKDDARARMDFYFYKVNCEFGSYDARIRKLEEDMSSFKKERVQQSLQNSAKKIIQPVEKPGSRAVLKEAEKQRKSREKFKSYVPEADAAVERKSTRPKRPPTKKARIEDNFVDTDNIRNNGQETKIQKNQYDITPEHDVCNEI